MRSVLWFDACLTRFAVPPAVRTGAGAVALLLSSACATTTPPDAMPAGPAPPITVDAVGMVSPDVPLPKGYIDPAGLPDSLALLPPPPAPGSAAKSADQEAFQAALGATADRQAMATADADLAWPAVIRPFEQILGISLSDGSRPNVEMLLRRSITDAGLSTYRAKNHYQRVRPFVENGATTCTPADEPALRKDGSYPSGHTAIGWMIALVLTDLAPDRQDALLRRGYEFGESRVVCRVHWLSDTVSGRVIASATYARLQSDPVFTAQRARARDELARAR